MALSADFLDYLPEMNERGLVLKSTCRRLPSVRSMTALTVASTTEYASCSGLDAFFLAGIAPESIIALSLSPTKNKILGVVNAIDSAGRLGQRLQ
jgi:hypothetical protein